MAVERKQRKGKRGHGEGTIGQRSDGRWIAQVMVGYKSDGKPDRRTVYGKTRSECQRKLDELRRRARSGLIGDAGAGRESVGAFLARWLDAIDGTIRPSTLYRYRVIVNNHLVPTIGRYKLADLRPEHLVQLYAEKRKAGLAPRTVKYLHTTIRKALTLAVEWGALPRNVAAVVKAPKVPRVEIKPPSATEVARLLETAEACGDRLAPLWAVMVYSGCREGELLGLRWDDVDLDNGTIRIRRTLQSVKHGVPMFDEPKTQALPGRSASRRPPLRCSASSAIGRTLSGSASARPTPTMAWCSLPVPGTRSTRPASRTSSR